MTELKCGLCGAELFSVVMKREKVTITLAEEDSTTNILIKQAP